MDTSIRVPIRSAARALALGAALTAGAGTAAAGELAALPWEVWNDPRSLPRLTPAHQVLMRSSHCPDGCRFDRHSMGDSRFIRLDGDEGVIFEEAGAGAITRIWMTQGAAGLSLPLDYISGLGNLDERMLVLVDIEKMLTSEEMALVEEAGE